MGNATLTGTLFAEMIRSGAALLSLNRQIVNDLNVFPIPDGDTGDNMFMTIDSGINKLKDLGTGSLDETAKKLAGGMLSGARGNSGAILSQFFAGVSRGFEGMESCDAEGLSKAFGCGVEQAYKAVKQPVEGTILTVFKDAVKYADSRVTENSTVDNYLDDFVVELYKSLDRTPELLSVLKEAGVVDSGGAGFVYIAEGMKKALEGESLEYENTSSGTGNAQADLDFDKFTEDTELEFGYCTEFLLRLQNKKCDVKSFDIKPVTDYLDTVGDSVVAFADGSVLKVHVHTFKPGDVLNHFQQYGEYLKIKIENMTLQHNESTVKNSFRPLRKKPHKQFALVAVAAGDGIKNAFTEAGCDEVVDGGQSMNPAVSDFINAFDNIDADTIFVFPNNGNIIMTANQAAQMYDKAEIRVLPTKTIGEGYAAISVFDPSCGDADELFEGLQEAAASVVTGMVSRAVRDTEKDGVSVKKNDFIGFVGDRIMTAAATPGAAAQALAAKMGAGDYDILILISGAGAAPGDAESLSAELGKAFKSTEVIHIEGGQPVFDYIIILE